MGSAQSTPTAAERAVIARLRALQLEGKKKQKSAVNEDGFVEVESESSSLDEKTLDALRRSPTTLDVTQLEDWQTRLLEDPKNRYVHIYTCTRTTPINSVMHPSRLPPAPTLLFSQEKKIYFVHDLIRSPRVLFSQTRPVRPLRRQPPGRAHLARRQDRRPAGIQHPDPFRGRAHYQPTQQRALLAIRRHQCFPHRPDAEVQPRVVRAEPVVALLLVSLPKPAPPPFLPFHKFAGDYFESVVGGGEHKSKL